jgi:protein SCO1/2
MRLNRKPLFLLLLLTLAVLLSSCMKSPEPKAKGPVQRYQIRGMVVRLDPPAHAAVIQHQKIEGWMEAMTMEFPVKDEQEYNNLHSGDRIEGTVFVQDLDYWVGEIHMQTPGGDSSAKPGNVEKGQAR